MPVDERTSMQSERAYPQSERRSIPCYAIHYIRWLSDCGAAIDIGPDAFAVLVAIVSKEDELHYSRAPKFFNDHLRDRCGIGSEPALIRARKRAVDAGLLIYEPGAKRRQGRYFVDGFANDSLAKPKLSVSESEGKPELSVCPTNPITQYPVPNSQKLSHEDGFKLAFSSKAFASAWERWERHCRQDKGKPLGVIQSEQLMIELSRFGEAEAIEIINFSIRRGSMNLLTNGDHKGPQRTRVAESFQRPNHVNNKELVKVGE